MINKIIEHIIRVYEFELVSSSVPRNDLQYHKMNFYLFIKYRISERLFLFLRKISPIKYEVERPDKSIWLRKRMDDELCEIEINPIPPEAAIYQTHTYRPPNSGWTRNAVDYDGFYKPQHSGNYKVRMYLPPKTLPPKYMNDNYMTFNINLITGIQTIDYFFIKVPDLKEQLRDYKLLSLLNTENKK